MLSRFYGRVNYGSQVLAREVKDAWLVLANARVSGPRGARDNIRPTVPRDKSLELRIYFDVFTFDDCANWSVAADTRHPSSIREFCGQVAFGAVNEK